MGVMGQPFIFDGIPSERFEASLVFIDGDWTKRPSGGNRQFITDYVHGNSKSMLLDVTQTEPLQFDIEVVFEHPVDLYTLSIIKSWLSSPKKFSKLYICNDKYSDIYYNCYINLTNDLVFNGGFRGVQGTVVCDSPFAWENQKVINLNSGENIFYNNSNDSNPMKPVVSFTTSSNYSYIIIENVVRNASNNIIYDRTSIFESKDSPQISHTQKNGDIVYFKAPSISKSLSPNENIIIDNQFNIIQSQINKIGLSGNFNKIFLKIPQGKNYLYITTYHVGDVKMMYQNAKMIGGGWY